MASKILYYTFVFPFKLAFVLTTVLAKLTFDAASRRLYSITAKPGRMLKRAKKLSKEKRPDVFEKKFNQLCKFIQKNKIDINTQDEKGNTILHYLAGLYEPLDETDFTDILLKMGADANILNKRCESPLQYVADKLAVLTREDRAKILQENLFFEIIYSFPQRLMDATDKERLNKKRAGGDTILTNVAKNNPNLSPELIEKLIQGGCDPNVPDRYERTLLSQLVYNIGLGRIPEYFLDKNPWGIEQSQKTYFPRLVKTFFYCVKNHPGSIPDSYNQQLKSALATADAEKLESRCFAAVLIKKGERMPEANSLLRDVAARDQKKPFWHFKTLHLPENYFEDWPTIVYQNILCLTTDIDEKNEQGQTALQLAIENNNADLAFLLIKNGADILTEDNAGNTLLHSAAKGKCASVLSYLLGKKQLDANALNNQGETPLSLTDGNQQTTALLLQYEASPEKQEKLVFDFDELTSKQTADMLISNNGVDVARKTKKLRPAIEYMEHKDRMRAYVHIKKRLTEKEKEDIEAIIRSGTQKTNLTADEIAPQQPLKITTSTHPNQQIDNQKEKD